MFEDMFGSENEPLPGAPGAPEAPAAAAPEAPPPAIAAPEAPPTEQAPTPAAAPEAPPAEPREGHVPIGALTEERARRRELQDQLNQTNARFNELLLRMQQAQQPQQPPAQIPAFEDNPAEHLRAMQQQFAQQMAELRDQMSGQNQRSQVTDQHAQFVQAVAAHEADFAARTSDYHAATAFVQQRKLTEYKAVGLSDVEARQALARDTMSVAQLAISRGQNPAEVMYGLAKTMGYAGSAPGNVSASAPAASRAAAPTSLQSTGGAPGADVAGQPTPEMIANMSDSEFDAFWNKFAGAQQQGGARFQ